MIHTLTKQALEEFRTKYTENDKGRNSILEAVASWEVEEWYTSTITRLLEAEIEDCSLILSHLSNYDQPEVSSNREIYLVDALTERVAYLKAELAKIKEI